MCAERPSGWSRSRLDEVRGGRYPAQAPIPAPADNSAAHRAPCSGRTALCNICRLDIAPQSARELFARHDASPASVWQVSHVSDVLVYRGSVSEPLVADRWCLGLRLNEVAAAVDLDPPTGRFDMRPGSQSGDVWDSFLNLTSCEASAPRIISRTSPGGGSTVAGEIDVAVHTRRFLPSYRHPARYSCLCQMFVECRESAPSTAHSQTTATAMTLPEAFRAAGPAGVRKYTVEEAPRVPYSVGMTSCSLHAARRLQL